MSKSKNVGPISSVRQRKGTAPSSASSSASEDGTSASSSATSPVTLVKGTRAPFAPFVLAPPYGVYKGLVRNPFPRRLEQDVPSASSARPALAETSARANDERTLSRDQLTMAGLSSEQIDQHAGMVGTLKSEGPKEAVTHVLMGFVGAAAPPLAVAAEIAAKFSLLKAMNTEPQKAPNHKAILQNAYAARSRNSATTMSRTTVKSR